jgi:Zn finger protein HypA/HybF involved in hydrogenase expression
MRKMYIVEHEGIIEFLCEECLDDDDKIIEETADVSCDSCGYSDMPY